MVSNCSERLWARSRKQTTQQEQETAQLLVSYRKAPTTELRNRIATLNDKLAIAIARRYSERCNLPLEDLIQLGRIGLIKAIEKFRPSEGAALSSFAVPYIEGEIKHFLRDHKGLVKTPRRWQEKSDAVRSAQLKAARAGRNLPADVVAKKGLGLQSEKWEAIAHATQHRPLVSLDEEEALQVADEASTNLEEMEEQERIKGAILHRLAQLPEQERNCIVERYWAGLSDELIGKRQGLSASTVAGLIAHGLESLRNLEGAA